MNPGRDEAAVRILEEVLAEFAFVFGDPRSPEEVPGLGGRAYLACLPYRAAAAGFIALGVPEPLAREIAANTLGVESSDPGVSLRAQDAVKELASVMAGYLAGAMEAPGVAVTLFPPQIFPLVPEDWHRLRTDPQTLCFSVNDQPVLLRVGPEFGGSST